MIRKFFRDHILYHEPTSRAYRKKLARDLIAILIVVTANVGMEGLGFYDRYRLIDLDHLARTAETGTRTSFDVSIVQIDDDLYDDKFKGTSPLDCRIVSNIIEGILAGNPRVLAVDLDTSRWPPACSRTVAKSPTPIVWSVEPDSKHNIAIEPGLRYGVPVFQPGLDGRLRSYQRGVPNTMVNGSPAPNGGLAVSFATAAVWATDPGRVASSLDAEEHLIAFGATTHRFRKLPASVFLQPDLAQGLYPAAVTGKIVFLGGTFHAARDIYATPLGPEPGVEVLAQAAQSEFSGPLRDLNLLQGLVEDFLVSAFILLFVIWFEPLPQLILTAVLSVTLVWYVSQYAYQTETVFLPLCTVLGGVFIAGFVEFCLNYREIKRENRELKQERAMTRVSSI